MPASATGVVAIAGGTFHSLALRSNGTVIAWGFNANGQTNVPASATGVVAIAGGRNHSLALRSNGTVIAWGSNSDGQINVPASATGVVAIAGGEFHSLALRSDGTVIAWGANYAGQASVPVTLTGVEAIASGGEHGLALRAARVPSQLARLDVETTTFAGSVVVAGALIGSPPYIKVAEVQAVGVAAGANVAGTNNFRNLNTELTDTHNLASIANGDVNLSAGTYYCRISAPAYRVDENQTRLRTSTGTVLLYGTSTYSDNTLSPSVQTYSTIEGQFTLGSTATLQVQHYMKTVRSPNGLGLPASATWGDGLPYEVYTVAEFWKIK